MAQITVMYALIMIVDHDHGCPREQGGVQFLFAGIVGAHGHDMGAGPDIVGHDQRRS